jgi:hypothetical protein
MRDELYDPVGKRNDKIIPVFLIHGSEHLRELLNYGGVIADAPMEQVISACNVGNEMVWATH